MACAHIAFVFHWYHPEAEHSEQGMEISCIM